MRLIAALIGLVMLLPSDIAAAQNSGFSPAGQKAVRGVAVVRSATLETATFATYPASTQSAIISHVFPGGSFISGSQVRFMLWGQIANVSGTPKSFSPSVYVTQNAAIQSAAFLYTAPNGTSEWVLEGAVSFSVPGPAATTLPTSREQAQSASTMLAAGSLIRLSNRTGVGVIAQDMAVVADPNTLLIDNFQPVGISVQVTTGASETFTVLGGWMEGL